ncbi:hypothetical protein MUU08_24410, partial [Salmonella enterica subsp. enterica serovar Heidelberg]|nr:hypothetical protein [Salmonella enterica subsp. enterica serovar Heidelberg]
FSSENYDALIADAESVEISPSQRWKLLLEAEKQLLNDGIIAPIYQEYKAVLQKDKVDGIIAHPVGAEYTYKWADIVQ